MTGWIIEIKRILIILFAITTLTCISGYYCRVAAGILTINTSTTVKVVDNLLIVTVVVNNKGTVPAHNVQAHLLVLGDRLSGGMRKILGVNQSDTVRFEKSVRGIKKGRYPLSIYVDFHDANQYLFSTTSVTTFSYKEGLDADIKGTIDDLVLKKAGNLEITFKNSGAKTRKGFINLILPKELSATRPAMKFQINPGTEKSSVFKITNRSALNASYPVYCYFEYETDDIHNTAVATGIVRISGNTGKNWFYSTRWLWLLGLGVMVLTVAVYYMLYARKKRL